MAPMVVGGTDYSPPATITQKRTFIGPLVRVVVQVAPALIRMIVNAGMMAYQMEVKGGSKAAEATSRGKMSEREAMMVLNVTEGWTVEEVNERYERYFAANDPDKGGSFYLQSKVYRAKEALDAAAAAGRAGKAESAE